MKQTNSEKIQNKLRGKFIKSGVKMIGPNTIYFSKDTKIGKNVTINPFVVFGPKVKVGDNVKINSFSHKVHFFAPKRKMCTFCSKVLPGHLGPHLSRANPGEYSRIRRWIF